MLKLKTKQLRWSVSALVVFGVGSLLAGAGLLRTDSLALTGGPGLGLPPRLAGAPATAVQSGQAAISAIGSLHGRGLELVDAAVAQYGEATVWVSQSRDEQGAADLTAAMASRIASTNSPFTPAGTRKIDSRLVYVLNGMGQAHFYWQAGKKVVWMAANPAGADRLSANL